MGVAPSQNIPQKLNQSVHGNFDIGVCGYDLKNGYMKPARCGNNMPSNNSNTTTRFISDLNMPKLPVNSCVPVSNPEIGLGVMLKKDLNNTSRNPVSNYKLSTCAHDYKSIFEIPEHLQVDKIAKLAYDMNKQKIMDHKNNLHPPPNARRYFPRPAPANLRQLQSTSTPPALPISPLPLQSTSGSSSQPPHPLRSLQVGK